jgi:hypothetical protein
MIPEKPDWSEIATDIKRRLRKSDISIGKQIGISGPTFQNIRNGRYNDVRYWVGASIINLWERLKNDGNKAST